MSVLRQVHLVAASMVFFAFFGAHFIHPNLIYLALLVGVGLTISGSTGVCPMALLLERLPWNKGKSYGGEVKVEVTKSSCCR